MTSVQPPTALVEAARRVDVGWSQQRLEHNLERVRARRAKRQRRNVAVASLVAVAAAAAVTLFLAATLRKPLASVAHSPSAAVASQKPETTFADGSVARAAEGAELVVKSASPALVESVLLRGAADFVVTKNPGRKFVVEAGPVSVHVLGTRFRVERSGERTRVSVSEGKVEVREGAARSYLEAGESRFFPAVVAVPEPAAALPSAPATTASARTRFLELARGGEFKAAYQVMSQSPAAVGSSAEELMLAADAARNSGHPEQAVGYLRRVTSEHRGDSRAPLAAFTLGRVLLSQLGRPGEAGEAFALVRRLRPGGGLAEDALAREAEARAAAGAGARARALATEYLKQYPQGKHSPTMKPLATVQ
jgi:transmembrane sensor